MRWRGESVCIIASGPSLTRDDADYARKHCDRVLVVNSSWRMCPTADALYAADSAWWLHMAPKPDEFPGERWTQDKQWKTNLPPGVRMVTSKAGIALPPVGADYVYTGHNSSFQALGLAVAWGAAFVAFIGLDLSMSPDMKNHWHDDYPEPVRNVTTAYPTFRRAFDKVAPLLTEAGVYVVNASRRTALESFPRMSIEAACAEFKNRRTA